jgi:hypothetical protein
MLASSPMVTSLFGGEFLSAFCSLFFVFGTFFTSGIAFVSRQAKFFFNFLGRIPGLHSPRKKNAILQYLFVSQKK